MGTGTRFPISVHVIVHNTTGANSPTVKHLNKKEIKSQKFKSSQSQLIYIDIFLMFLIQIFSLYIEANKNFAPYNFNKV